MKSPEGAASVARYALIIDTPLVLCKRLSVASGVEVPIPIRPVLFETYKDGDEVPTVKSPLPKGVVVPTASNPAKAEVAVDEVAVK